ncbi:glycosyl transferase family protein [bacterium]|nr:glycosyl transferase family protein [bacterium]
MVIAVFVLSGLDDIFIDLNAVLRRLGPRKICDERLRALREMPPRKIAIIIPAWDESSVIGRMLAGNLARIDYPRESYAFYVGVYPNDPATIQAVQRVAASHGNVHAVASPLPGPTSKGQILNHVTRFLMDAARDGTAEWDAILLHDAEDLIHPLSLWLINDRLRENHYVQIPVFSLPLAWNQLVAGTYIDEFAESHTKDVLVRSRLGAPLPSAGVGTALRRDLVENLPRGELLNEKSLTEDYELGVRVGLAGFKQEFAACFVMDGTGRRDYIATREFFPKGFYRSIRQKTRWTMGITIQGWRNLRWPGNLRDRYFLFRDRKGIVTNPATVVGYLVIPGSWHLDPSNRPLLVGISLLAVNRMFQRFLCVLRVYGPTTALMCLPRWPVACIINAAATFRAMKQHIESQWSGKAVRWVKTEHDLPEGFGV